MYFCAYWFSLLLLYFVVVVVVHFFLIEITTQNHTITHGNLYTNKKKQQTKIGIMKMENCGSTQNENFSNVLVQKHIARISENKRFF